MIFQNAELHNITELGHSFHADGVSGLSSDGLHPANSGHYEIARNLYEAMK